MFFLSLLILLYCLDTIKSIVVSIMLGLLFFVKTKESFVVVMEEISHARNKCTMMHFIDLYRQKNLLMLLNNSFLAV